MNSNKKYDDALNKLSDLIYDDDSKIAITACKEILDRCEKKSDSSCLKWFIDYEKG